MRYKMTNGISKTKMKILIVGMIDSIHLARWISQIKDQNWEVYLFPVELAFPHLELRNITVFAAKFFRMAVLDRSVRYIRWSSLSFYLDELNSRLMRQSSNKFKEQALVRAIQSIKPDIVHSLEFQHAGYLTLSAKMKLGDKFPKWIATNWGSDIYLFGRLAEHREHVRAVLENCNYYSCECERDVILAREYGLRGEVLPVLPNAGGFDLAKCESLRQPGNTSERKIILLKGYQNWAGRALSGLRALARCQDILKDHDYSIAIFSATPDVKIAAELFSGEIGVPVEIIPPCSHTEMLKKYGQARVYIGLSISDAISTSLLESLVMGAFPVQSCTSCADEWIADGQSGLVVPPEDVDIIEKALRRALTDDALVDQAAALNRETARKRLNSSVIQPQVIDFYKRVYNSKLEK